MEMQGKRIDWLDIMKGVLILFVILSHSYPAEIYRQFFTPFFLSMFFFASGYFFSRKASFGDFIKNKRYHLVLPLLLLGGIRMLISYVIERDSLLLRVGGLLLQISCKYDEMWFLSCLFVAELIFYGIITLTKRLGERNAKSRSWESAMILTGSLFLLLTGYADICFWRIRFPWEAEIACIMVIYLAMGYLYRQWEERILILEKGKWIWLLAAVYLAGTLLMHPPTDIHAEEFPMPVLFFLLSFLAIPLVIAVSKKLQNTVLKRPLMFLGRNTLFYFAFGGFGRMIVCAVTDRMGITDAYMTPVLCVLFSAVIMAFPARMVQKYAPWLVGQKKAQT